MLKLLAAIVGLVVLVLIVRAFSAGDADLPADPLTASANLDLRVKAQAGIQVTVASLANQMKQVMAAGNEPAQRKALDHDLATMHADIEAARANLAGLGDSPAAIEQWLARIGWPEFQRLEADYRRAGGP